MRWILGLLAACAAVDPESPDSRIPPLPFEPEQPAADCLMLVARPPQLELLGPFTVDTTGIDRWLVLDASAAPWQATFYADTEPQRTRDSPFVLELRANTFVLATGWDTMSTRPPSTNTSLVYVVDGRQIVQTMIHLAAKTDPATTTLRIELVSIDTL